MSAKRAETKAIHDRIAALEDALTRARAYLATGAHAEWHGFRARFAQKLREGEQLPPHKDWVRNVFIPQTERAISRSERALEAVNRRSRSRVG